jgi:hypothetical protein
MGIAVNTPSVISVMIIKIGRRHHTKTNSELRILV